MKALMEEMENISRAKNKDYASEDDALANLRGMETCNIPAWINSYARLKDKTCRIDAFIRNDGEFQVKDECFHDTAIDLAVYALLTLICWEQEQLAEDKSGAAEELPRPTGCAPTQASARSNH